MDGTDKKNMQTKDDIFEAILESEEITFELAQEVWEKASELKLI